MSPSISPSQSIDSGTSSLNIKTENPIPIPIENVEQVVRSKSSKRHLPLDVAFVPRPVKTEKESDESSDDNGVIVIDDEGSRSAPTTPKKSSGSHASEEPPSERPPRMTEAEANGRKLTDG